VSFPVILVEMSGDMQFARAEGEEIGPVRRARLLHVVLDKSSGSVKLPAKAKKSNGQYDQVPVGIAIPTGGRVEDSMIYGFFDRRADSDLLVRIAEYAKANPSHELPWIDIHPSGVETKTDGHGSWSKETPSGHAIKLIERDGEVSVEIVTADDTPLTLRARGTGKVLLHSDSGDVEVVAGGDIKLTAQNVEVVSEQNAESKAVGDNQIIGRSVDVLASEDASIAAAGDVNIGASGSASFLANVVKLGVEGAVKNLVTDTFIEIFNLHTHGGVQTGSGVSGPPVTPANEAAVTTANVEAS
jgi:hypothetical protein